MKRIYITLAALIMSATSFAGDTDSLMQDTIQWFYVNRQSADIQITWAAGEQLKSNHFEIQRSTDQQNWRTIALVLASADPQLAQQYSYIDTGAGEVVYYRIRQVDMNGQVHYSSIRAVRNPKELYRIAMHTIPENGHCRVRVSEAGGSSTSKILIG